MRTLGGGGVIPVHPPLPWENKGRSTLGKARLKTGPSSKGPGHMVLGECVCAECLQVGRRQGWLG